MPNEIIPSGLGLNNLLKCVHLDWELKKTPVITKAQVEGTCIPGQLLEMSLNLDTVGTAIEASNHLSSEDFVSYCRFLSLPVRQNVLKFIKYV